MQYLQALIDILPLLGQGFFGVFFVIALIWLCIEGLRKICK